MNGRFTEVSLKYKNFMEKIYKKITRWNKKIFSHIVPLTYSLLLIESLTYRGFVKKFLVLDITFLIFCTVLSGFLLLLESYFFNKQPKGNLVVFVLKFNHLLFLPLCVSYYILVAVEAENYPNFVYSTFHLLPDNLAPLVLLSAYLLIINKFIVRPIKINPKTVWEKINFWNVVLAISLLFFFLFLAKDILFTVRSSAKTISESIGYINKSKEEKMRDRFGVVYDFARFIRENTPENSYILIPPQEYPWPMTGNVLFFRYFLYPRRLINGGTYEVGVDIVNEKIDYILIAKGELKLDCCGFDYGWPKFKFSGEKIILVDTYDEKGKATTEEMPGEYDPKTFSDTSGWGLIKIRKR